MATNGEFSIEETQARLTSQVTRESQVAAGDLRMIEDSPQTWPDSSLGCPGRRRMLGTYPVPGYRFVLDAGGKRRTYHADTRGRIVRCDAPSKPLDPPAARDARSLASAAVFAVMARPPLFDVTGRRNRWCRVLLK